MYVIKTVPEKNSYYFVYVRISVEYRIYISDSITTSVYQTAS